MFMHPYSENFDIVIKSVNEEQIVEKMAFEFGEDAGEGVDF